MKLKSMKKNRKKPVTCCIYNQATVEFGGKVDTHVYF